jgi:uncharacterized protein YigE (DUF2233 family)
MRQRRLFIRPPGLRGASVTRFPFLILAAATMAGEALAACRIEAAGGADYVVCEFSARTDRIEFFLRDETGAPYGEFSALKDALAAKGEALVFAMNAGMYREDRSPVGLYVENGATLRRASMRDGPGNFHLKPNGVFSIGKGEARVSETGAFLAVGDAPDFATQSGPMLVIDGAVHPKFLPDSDSRKRRNGVGVAAGGEKIFFVLSDSPVTLHAFATFFRDALKTPNALYLDGTISRVFAPELSRNDPGLPMGPIVAVVEAHD